ASVRREAILSRRRARGRTWGSASAWPRLRRFHARTMLIRKRSRSSGIGRSKFLCSCSRICSAPRNTQGFLPNRNKQFTGTTRSRRAERSAFLFCRNVRVRDRKSRRRCRSAAEFASSLFQHFGEARFERGVDARAVSDDGGGPVEIFLAARDVPHRRRRVRHVDDVGDLVAELDQHGVGREAVRVLDLKLLALRFAERFVVADRLDERAYARAEGGLELGRR